MIMVAAMCDSLCNCKQSSGSVGRSLRAPHVSQVAPFSCGCRPAGQPAEANKWATCAAWKQAVAGSGLEGGAVHSTPSLEAG